MKTPLGLLNLQHQLTRTLVSTAGVGFALLLVFMQLGFQGAVSHTATNVYQNMNFDLVIRSADYAHLYEPGRLARTNLNVAAGLDGIHDVVPVWIALQNWLSLPPEENSDCQPQPPRKFLPSAVMGIQPKDHVFSRQELTDLEYLLASDQNLLVDNSTRPDYGPCKGKRFTDEDKGRATEVGGKNFKIVGVFKLGTGLAANAAVLMSAQGFDRAVPWDASKIVSLGLVRLKPEAKAAAGIVQAELRERLGKVSPSDRSITVDVLTRDEAIEWEEQRWLWQTPIGLIFQLGVGLSLLVGAAIVYMVLATDVTDRLPEYATLLAIGYSYRYLCTVVLSQAVTLGICGFLLAWGVSEVLYRVTAEASGIPISMNPGRIVFVGLLGIVVCLVSGTLALRKLWKAEPASLF